MVGSAILLWISTASRCANTMELSLITMTMSRCSKSIIQSAKLWSARLREQVLQSLLTITCAPRQKKESELHLRQGNAVQEPLITYGVHNDYTAASAPRRLEQLALPPKQNDTLKPVLGDRPAVDPAAVPELLTKRWAIINVWRNVTAKPVHRFPLGICESSSTTTDDLVVFEIHYADRIGENYFARHSASHVWSYFPQITRDEVILLKTWDSHGVDFAEAALSKDRLVPSTFALHTAFEDPATPEGAPDRESIEVRVMAFFDN
mmetsp:Transcript_124242/g.220150  ORF Transcript_124242/g.220150 Transcript_124242/m.220150 type:complete len:264 (-) Transcript_124242:40-831(-)